MAPVTLRNTPALGVPLSDEQFQLIGLICNAWAQIELAIDMLILHGARIDQPTLKIMMDGKMMRGKMDVLKELADLSPHKQMASLFRPIYASLLKHIHKRNDAVHGMWTSGQSPSAFMYYKERSISATELKPTAEALNAISCHLWHLQWLAFKGLDVEQSPWSDRLEPLDS